MKNIILIITIIFIFTYSYYGIKKWDKFLWEIRKNHRRFD